MYKKKIKYHKFEKDKELKHCSNCNCWVSLDNFSNRKSEWDGLYYNCNTCKSEWESNYKKKYRLQNSKKIINYQRKYRKNNPKVDKNYYIKNKSTLLAKAKNYRKIHIKEKKLRDKVYYIKNKDKIIEYHRYYTKTRRKTDIKYKLIGNLRGRLYKALKGLVKKDTTKNLLSCSIEFLKQYLQSLFTEGMSWDNYGKYKKNWNIDHIIPCASFDLTEEKEQRKCFHWSNLQPLWSEDNLRKSSNLV